MIKEVRNNIDLIQGLSAGWLPGDHPENLRIFNGINGVLNSINRLEVRGRDSAGISVLMTMTKGVFEAFCTALKKAGLSDELKRRTNHTVLANNSITIHDRTTSGDHWVTIFFVYKFAAEIGSLGDNITFIRSQV